MARKTPSFIGNTYLPPLSVKCLKTILNDVGDASIEDFFNAPEVDKRYRVYLNGKIVYSTDNREDAKKYLNLYGDYMWDSDAEMVFEKQ